MLVQNCEGSCEETKKNSSLCAADHSRILQMHCGPSWGFAASVAIEASR